MDTIYHITIADGTEFDAQPDNVGNLICAERLDKGIFTDDNLARVTIEANGTVSVYTNQILRTFYHQPDGTTFIRIDEKTEMEKLKTEYEATIQLLTDCILEMSEEIYT